MLQWMQTGEYDYEWLNNQYTGLVLFGALLLGQGVVIRLLLGSRCTNAGQQTGVRRGGSGPTKEAYRINLWE